VVQVWNITTLPLISDDELIPFACSHLTSNFSSSEWDELFEGEDYKQICPGLPEGK
jgi:hypothetical protein